MALNFGLGFSFRGNDLGLGKAVNGLSRDFRSLGKEMLGLQRMQTMLAALSFDRLNELGDKLKTLGTGGQELTDSIDETFTGYSKELSKFGVAVGKTGEEMKTFKKAASSMAYGLNMDVGAAVKALYGFDAGTKDLKVADILAKLGVDSAKTLAKFSEQAGVDAAKFSYNLLQMGVNSHLGADAVARIAQEATLFGQESNTLNESLGAMDELTALLHTRSILGDSPKAVESFGKQTFGAARALYALTQDGAHAKEAAFELASVLTKSKKGFADLLVGSATALPDFTKAFAAYGPGVDAAFEAMKQGPQEFMKTLAEVVDRTEKNGGDVEAALALFRPHMEASLGEKTTEMLVGNLGDAKKRAMLIGGVAKDASKVSLGEIAKTYETGLTAAAIFERQQQGFMHRFRNLSTVSTNQFLSDSQASFNSFGAKMEKVAAEGGPLSLVIGKLADIQKYGAKGLFPANLQGPLAALGTAAETLIGPLAKLRSIGIDLMSPFGALVGVFAGLGAKMLSNFVTIEDQVGPALEKMALTTAERTSIIASMALEETGKEIIVFMKEKLPRYLETGIKFISNFARKLLSGGLFGDGAITGDKDTDAILNAVIFTLKEAFGKALAFAKEMFTGFMSGLMGEKIDPKAGDATVIGGAIGTMLHDALIFAFGEAKKALTGMWGGLMGDPLAEDAGTSETLGHSLGETLRVAFDFALEELKTYMAGWWDRMVAIWNDPNKTFMEKVKAWFGESLPLLIAGAIIGLTFFGPIIAAFASLAGFIFKLAFTALWEHSLKQVFINIATKMWGWFLRFGKFLLNGIGTIIRGIASFLWNVLTTVFRTIVGALGAAGLIVVAAFVAFFVGMFTMAEQEGDTFQETWDRMWNTIFTTFQYYGNQIWGALKFVGENVVVIFKNLGAGIANFFLGTWDSVMEIATTGYNFMTKITNSLVAVLLSPITMMFQVIGKLISGLGDMIANNPSISSLFDIDPATVAGLQNTGKALQDMKSTDIIPAAEKMADHVKSRRYDMLDFADFDGGPSLGQMLLDINGPEKAPAKETEAELEQRRKDFRKEQGKGALTEAELEKARKDSRARRGERALTEAELKKERKDSLAKRGGLPDLAMGGLPDLAMGAGVLADKGGPTDWVSVASANKENSAAVVSALENPKWAADQITEAAKQTAILETIRKVLEENRASNAAAAAGTRTGTRSGTRSSSPAAGAARTTSPAPLSPRSGTGHHGLPPP